MKKGHGKAIKDGDGWRVEFSDEFLAELKDLPQADQDQIKELMEGLKDGSVDPMTMGIRMCGYCGNDLPPENEPGEDMCAKCQNSLR